VDEFKLAQHWADGANWRFGIFYRAPDDPRLLVAMRGTNAGWTPNVAHPRAIVLAAALSVVALTPTIGISIAGAWKNEMAIPLALMWFLVVVVPVGVLVRRGLE
jgi:hypothetical protein